MELVDRRLSSLARSVGPRGEVDWAAFATDCGVPVLPETEIESPSEFLAALPHVIECVIGSCENEVDRAILRERLSKVPGERSTLDEIARQVGVRVTRERVRQREVRLLRWLYMGFTSGDSRGLAVQFRASFVAYWNMAIADLEGFETLDFGQFFAVLERNWGARTSDLVRHLPLILAVLTKQSQVPRALSATMRLHPAAFGNIGYETAQLPVSRFPVGRALPVLLQSGVKNLGDLFEAARSSRLPALPARSEECIRVLIDALAASLDAHGELNWTAFSDRMRLIPFPPHPRLSAESFLLSLYEDLDELVSSCKVTGRALEIFRRRTSVPSARRPTLDEIAKVLGTHGPTVKREESVLLSALHSIFVRSDSSDFPLAVDSSYLGFWATALAQFENSGGSFSNFCSRLSHEWNLPVDRVFSKAELLWAVVMRYPVRANDGEQDQGMAREVRPLDGGLVVLRGFRTEH